jgi:O-antigen/teichoic acid export membrane protein
MAAHPIIMNAWQNLRREEVPGLVKSFSRYYLLAALPVVAIVSVLGREIVEVLVGEEFREGYRIIPWVLGGTAAWGLAMYGHKGFELLEKTRLMFVLVVVCALLNVLLNLVFVPRYGFTAAAVTTFAGYALYPVLVFVLTRRGLPWHIPWRTAAVSAAAALAGAATARVVANAVAVYVPVAAVVVCGGAAGVAAYAVLVRIAGELNPPAGVIKEDE